MAVKKAPSDRQPRPLSRPGLRWEIVRRVVAQHPTPGCIRPGVRPDPASHDGRTGRAREGTPSQKSYAVASTSSVNVSPRSAIVTSDAGGSKRSP